MFLFGISLNKYYLCYAMFDEKENSSSTVIPTDPEFQKGVGFICSCMADYKKCCEKYKKGKRCKKCPKAKK